MFPHHHNLLIPWLIGPRFLVLILAVLFPLARLNAQAPVSDELYRLRRRLDQAEARIGELEQIQRLPPVHTPQAAIQQNRFALRSDENSEEESGQDDVLKRLSELEKKWEKQEEKEKQQKEEELKDKLTKTTIDIGGRLHLDYWSFPYSTEGINYFENPDTGVDVEDRLLLRRLRLEIQGDITPAMLYKFDIEFGEPNNPQIRDAYLGFQQLPGNHQVQIGNQKRPLNLDTLDSSRNTIFMERPTMADAFNDDYRRLGVCVYGYSDNQVYNWSYGVFFLDNIAGTGRYIGDSLQGSLNGRLSSTPWYDETSGGRGYFHWGISGMLAHPDGNVDPLDSNDNEGRFHTRSEVRSTERWLDTGRIPLAQWYEVIGLEAMVNVGPWQVVGEYHHTWAQRDVDPALDFHGAYVYVSYFLTGEFMTYDRTRGVLDLVEPYENFFLVERCRGGWGGGWGAWQVALRLSYVDLTDQDIAGGEGRNVVLGLNWYWTAHSRLQFNAIYGRIEDRMPAGGFTEGEFVGLGTRFLCDF